LWCILVEPPYALCGRSSPLPQPIEVAPLGLDPTLSIHVAVDGALIGVVQVEGFGRLAMEGWRVPTLADASTQTEGPGDQEAVAEGGAVGGGHRDEFRTLGQ